MKIPKEKSIEKTENEIKGLGDYLNIIKINGKNIIEEVNNEDYIQHLINFSKALEIESENNIGKEINKFFNIVLNENKEGENLKVNIALSSRLYKEQNINEILDKILNKKETTELVLTKELSENISLILTNSYHKIKNKNIINSFDDLLTKINNFDFYKEDILRKYLIDGIDEHLKNHKLFGISRKTVNENIIHTKFQKVTNNIINEPNRNTELNFADKKQENNNNINLYKFKEFNEDKKLEIPIEMIILKRKFQNVKKLKLTLNSNSHIKGIKTNMNISSDSHFSNESPNYHEMSNDNIISNEIEDGILKQRDIDNNIFVLLNLSWLFPQLFEIEVDLSNENMINDYISLYKSKLLIFSNNVKRNIKETNYQKKDVKKIDYDPLRGSIFPDFSKKKEEPSSDEQSDSYSLQVNELSEEEYKNIDLNLNEMNEINEVNNVKENDITSFSDFIKKYKYNLEMIVIYGYFISKIPKLYFFDFRLPLNLEKEIISMLQRHQIYYQHFQFISFLSDLNLIRITLDFNSLDNKAFQEVLSLLIKSNNLHILQINFFPSENYFKSELLLKLIQDNNVNFKSVSLNKFNRKIIEEINSEEELDIYLLKKLSEYFETNINKLFHILFIKSTVSELSFIFNISSIMTKTEYYLTIILKVFINLFIAIDNSKLSLISFNFQAPNFPFDSRKYPFLIDFLNNLYIFKNKKLRLSKLTFHMRIIDIHNLYRIIPYNITELSIGEFDYESFVYFIEYLISSEFSVHSKLNKLKIYLSNTIVSIDETYIYLLNLIQEYPKCLKELSINTSLSISFKKLMLLLNSSNYNTLENIFLKFSKKSLKDKEYQNKENPINSNNFINLFFVKRTIKSTNLIKSNIMMNLSLKYNKNFMDYNIFRNIEKFLCNNSKKSYYVQFK